MWSCTVNWLMNIIETLRPHWTITVILCYFIRGFSNFQAIVLWIWSVKIPSSPIRYTRSVWYHATCRMSYLLVAWLLWSRFYLNGSFMKGKRCSTRQKTTASNFFRAAFNAWETKQCKKLKFLIPDIRLWKWITCCVEALLKHKTCWVLFWGVKEQSKE